MSANATPGSTPIALTARQQLALATIVAMLLFGLLVVVESLLDRPSVAPQLTFIGTDDALSVLVEGVGGGRVLIGGGPNGADLPAALGRHFVPWRRDLDLLIVADRRDLPGATELVRRGLVRAVLLVGLEEERAAATALVLLRDACVARGVSVRASAEPERVTIGRAGALTLDIVPALAVDNDAQVRVQVATLRATIVTGTAVSSPSSTVILLRAAADPYRAALSAAPQLVVAPALPAASVSTTVSVDSRFLLVAPGQRATLSVTDRGVSLRGATLTSLDTAGVSR
ncbi:MAG TPA: hypothetical protein VIL85_18070 [Thermomicrobiales bacterium]|jgi:hypothetical protein